MPVLPLTAEALGPGRTRLDLSAVDLVMLWPDDPAAREAADKSSRAQFIVDAIRGVSSDDQAPIDWDITKDLVELTAEALPLATVQERAQQRYAQGLAAGELLWTVIQRNESGQAAGLEEVKKEIVEKYCLMSSYSIPTAKYFRFSKSTLDNTIWARFKPVSHLWAAYYVQAYFNNKVAFPCTPQDLPEFLGLAEELRQRGESLIPAHRKTPLLDPGEMWRLPDGVVPPRVRIFVPENDRSKDD